MAAMNNNISFLRKKLGLSQQELANIIGTSQQQIDRLEKAERKLTADWMQKLSLALKCKPADLIDFTQTQSSATKVETAIARVIGAIETKFSNMVREFAADEQYEISFRPPKKDFGKKFFALVVEGGAFQTYPANSELIFTQGKVSPVNPSLRENASSFKAAASVKTNNYKFDIGNKCFEGHLVKSIRSE